MDKTKILNDLKEYKKFSSMRKFAQFLGITDQSLAQWYTRNSYNIQLLCDKFPEVDANYIVRGEGDMLRHTLNEGGVATGEGAMNHSNSDIIIEKFIDEIAEQRKVTQIILEQNAKLIQLLTPSKTDN